jgi:serine/threonine protein kinase
MSNLNVINGLQEQWQILDRLGEGDAGEIFRVEALRTRKTAVLKRPLQDGMPAEAARQAGQISSEARILKSLSSLSIPNGSARISIAHLLDESLPGNELTQRAFIVLEEAGGISLADMARLVQLGQPPDLRLPREEQHFIQVISASGRLPDLLLLRLARAVLSLLDALHRHPTHWIDTESSGILWNDVKTAHFFWEPGEARFWVIDWGNSQFLDAEGRTADGVSSPFSDYQQFAEELGRFILQSSPSLHMSLEWPDLLEPDQPSLEQLDELRRRLDDHLKDAQEKLAELRGREAYLAGMSQPDESALAETEDVQQQIILCGELPDYSASARLYAHWAALLVREARLHEFWEAARRWSGLPGPVAGKWKTLALAAAEIDPEADDDSVWQAALKAALDDDWLAALWEFCRMTRRDPEEARWKRLYSDIRRMLPEVNAGAPTPFTAVTRLAQILEDERMRLASAPARTNVLQTEAAAAAEEDPQQSSQANPQDRLAALLARMKNVVIKKWTHIDPVPPGSDLTYSALEEALDSLAATFREAGVDLSPRTAPLERSLTQARAQASIFQDAWRARGFRTARHSLRNLLLWDPDRRRVLQADQAVQAAPVWLQALTAGPMKGENLADFAIRIEFQGRDLRARVGPAPWLDSALALLAGLRSGRRPADIVQENPELAVDYPWLKKFRRREPLSAAKTGMNGQTLAAIPTEIRAVRLGQDEELLLAEALDSWVPEARGSSARVFNGFLSGRHGVLRQAAVKLMRPDKLDYALPLFAEEVRVLAALEEIPGVVSWLECGFIQLDEGQDLPHENSPLTAHSLTGSVVRLAPERASIYLSELEQRAHAGWIPYLALEKKHPEDNLLTQCDAGLTRGSFLPFEQAMQAALQITDILQSAHERRVVYRDHKILHYYWIAASGKVTVIDWNVARLHSEGLPDGEVHSDLVQLGARALHHLFTGRPAPGALPVGPTAPQEIEAAPETYAASWSYDDQQRLPLEVRQILAAVLDGAYSSALRLREDLLAQSPA